MGRDLLYKPPVPLVIPEEEDNKVPAHSLDKLGVRTRGRDLGGEDDKKPAKPAESEPAAPGKPEKKTAKSTEQPETPVRSPAFLSAYFNKDVEATAHVNQRASDMQALRGAQEATDLKKVVLPGSERVDTPDPQHLRAAGDLMGLGQTPPELQTMLQRHGTWLRQPHVTAEMIQQRLDQLEQMVAARVQSLARMARLPADRLARSVTLNRANSARGAALDEVADLREEGKELTHNTEEQAKPMHRRIAKTLGIKLPQ